MKTDNISDLPIKSMHDDTLGRYPFAKKIANSIINNSSSDCYCIGIEGDWGSGKTSILNMIEEEINSRDSKTLIIKFQPWMFSGQEDLIRHFLTEFNSVFNRPEIINNYAKLSKSLNQYLKLLQPIQPALSLLPYGNYIDIGFKAVTKLSKQLEDSADAALKLSKTTPLQAKNTLNKTIQESGLRFIVIIDDIDRLQSSEICSIFQMVKAVADFPNTTYLLAYDRPIIEEALKKEYATNGRSFLDKIVQMPIPVPMIQEKYLTELLINSIKTIANDIFTDDIRILFSHHKLGSFFHNLRDCYRFLNNFKFSYNIICNDVNLYDFICIYFFYIFDQQTYIKIKNNKEFIFSNNSTEQYKTFFDDILNTSSITNKVRLDKLLKDLFQGITTRETGYSEKRIMNIDYFDTYFSFVLDENVISHYELQIVLEDKIESQSHLVKETLMGNKSISFLKNIRSSELTPKQASHLLDEFFSFADSIAIDRNNQINDELSATIIALLSRQDITQAKERIKQEMNKATKLDIFINLTKSILWNYDYRTMAHELRPEFAQKIIQSIDNNTLFKSLRPLLLVNIAQEANGLEAVKPHLDTMLSDDMDFISFTLMFLYDDDPRFSFDKYKEYSDIEESYERLKGIDITSIKDTSQEEFKLVLALFDEYIKNTTQKSPQI